MRNLDGIGFVFTEDDPFAGIDLDDCIDDDGVPEAWALEVIAGFATYCEVSPSGRGFKLFVRGELPGGGTKKGQVELYDRNRFFTLTGKKFGSHDVVGDRQGALEDLYQKVKPHLTSPRRNDPDLTPGDSVDIPDSLLLQKARENRRTGSCSSGSSIAARRKGTARTLKRIWLLWAASRFGRTATRLGCLGSSMRQRSGSARSGRPERKYREDTADKAISGCNSGYTPDPLEVPNSTKEKLAKLRDLAQDVKWLEAGKPNDPFVYLALLEMVAQHGRRESGKGWRIIASPRDVALEAGTTNPTVRKSYKRLEALGLISDIAWGKKDKVTKGKSTKGKAVKGKATQLTVHNPKTVSATLNPYHTTHTGGIYSGNSVSPDRRDTQASEPPHRVSSSMVRIEETQISKYLRHIRNSSPTTDENGNRIACRRAPQVSPIPPGSKLIIYKLSSRGPRTLAELAQDLGAKRPDNLARLLPRLLDEGFVVEEGGQYRVCDDIEDRLRVELECSNSTESEEYYRDQDVQARRAYHAELQAQEERREEEPKKL